MGHALTPDRRLQGRIALGLGLVVASYAFFAAAITYLGRTTATVLAALGIPFVGTVTTVPWLVWIAVLTPLLIAGTYVMTRRWLDPRLFLADDALADGTDLEPRVTRLAKQAGVPAPDVVVAEATVPNSFVVGRPGNAILVVTSALLEELEGEELDAVVAHELAHVGNRDSALMTLVCGVFILNNIATQLVLLVVPTFGAKPINVEAGVIAGLVAVTMAYSIAIAGVAFSPLVFVGLVVRIWLFGLAIALFQVAMGYVTGPLTRARELAADRGAVEITGTAAPLASALETLHGHASSDVDARARNHGVTAVSLLPHATDLVSDPEQHVAVRLLDQFWVVGDIRESGVFGPVAEVLDWGAKSSVAAAGEGVDHPPVETRVEQLRTLERRRRESE